MPTATRSSQADWYGLGSVASLTSCSEIVQQHPAAPCAMRHLPTSTHTDTSRCGAGHNRTDHQAANQGLLPGKHNMNKRARHEEGLRPRSSEGRDPAFMTSNHVCWGHYGGLVAFRHLPTYLPSSVNHISAIIII